MPTYTYSRGNPKKKIGGKLYTRASQGWPNKNDAMKSAKSMRSIGYKARVVLEDGYYRIYWRE